ncbi:MAG TPA: HEAT repeat domain-containing protein, partial [Kofleriaceae bacterium]|nr:HEAT repeat domain-containing protein [Kofleriaceae bacterium]
MSQASVDRTSRVPVALLEPEARERQRAVEALTAAQLAEPAVSYALGRLLAADPDVSVRAAAAAALGRVRGEPGVQLDARPDAQLDAQPGARPGAQPDAQPGAQPDAQFDALAASWLLEALRDGSPVVRDAAVRALAARRCARAFGALTQLAQTDQVWWVRRAAVYALGTVGASFHGGAAAGGTAALGAPGAAWPDVDGEAPLAVSSEATIAAARAALSDPFWRVRHAAVQVLALCGARTPSLRDQILAEVEGGSADYLRALWGPALISATASATGAPVWESKLPAPLRDRDPAVVTARLAAMDSPPPLALVELLCDPHVPLRELAAARLTRAGDSEAFAAALRWLEEPRIPHVAETVTDLLDGLGDAARELAADVLAGAPRCGAARWAVGWVVATRDAELGEAAWRCAVRCSVRDVALPLASADELREILAGAGAG